MSTLELFDTDWRDIWGTEVPEDVGAIFTKPEVVDTILDLAGYTPEKSRLALSPLLEPSCGDGAFTDRAISRLIDSERTHLGEVDWSDPALTKAICASDISTVSLSIARDLIINRLVGEGCPPERALALSLAWTCHTDFLLHSWDRSFAFVVGNPPYVRLEDLPKGVLASYRARYETATDRADLYIPFFERSLQLLNSDGVLAFICANRFTKNQYGASLRRLLTSRYHIRHYINLEHTQPFQQDVSAYPAIIVIDREMGAPTLATTLDDCSPATLGHIRAQVQQDTDVQGPMTLFDTWYPDGGAWITTSASSLALLKRLDESFPVLESSGFDTKVGIGVATGADNVFVLPSKHPSIEESCQLPLVMASDVRSGTVTWSGHFLLNPFDTSDDGSLVDLAQYPGLAQYLQVSGDSLRSRHVAKNRPNSWFRTIDRVWPKLTATRKLLIPDIQAGGVVSLDEGQFYPHHNLYWVVSQSWPLEALQTILRSTFVLLQVQALSVAMRGGSLRYQAQTLRRLRVPSLPSISPSTMDILVAASTSRDQIAIDGAAALAFEFDLPSSLALAS